MELSGAAIDALQSVTKRDGEDYEDFVRRAAANPIGRRVKLADLHDNSDLSRIAVPLERDFQRIEVLTRDRPDQPAAGLRLLAPCECPEVSTFGR